MEATQGLTVEAYRTFHVVLQLAITLQGTIARGERALAGMSNQTVGRLRKSLLELESTGLIEADGSRIHCPLAMRLLAAEARRKKADRVISASLRQAVFDRDGLICTYCTNKDGPFEIDHVHPYSRGGATTMENLTVACLKCNRSKGDRTPEEWRP